MSKKSGEHPTDSPTSRMMIAMDGAYRFFSEALFAPVLGATPRRRWCRSRVARRSACSASSSRTIGPTAPRRSGLRPRRSCDAITDALDVLGSQIPHEIALGVHRGRVLVVDAQGHHRASTTAFDPAAPDVNDEHVRLNTDRLFAETLTRPSDLANRVLNTAALRDRQRLTDCLRALRRSVEAIRPEDQLLEAWMVLEALLGDEAGLHLTTTAGPISVTELRVAEVVSAIAVDSFRWEVAIAAHSAVCHAVSNQRFNKSVLVDADDATLTANGFRGISPAP